MIRYSIKIIPICGLEIMNPDGCHHLGWLLLDILLQYKTLAGRYTLYIILTILFELPVILQW